MRTLASACLLFTMSAGLSPVHAQSSFDDSVISLEIQAPMPAIEISQRLTGVTASYRDGQISDPTPNFNVLCLETTLSAITYSISSSNTVLSDNVGSGRLINSSLDDYVNYRLALLYGVGFFPAQIGANTSTTASLSDSVRGTLGCSTDSQPFRLVHSFIVSPSPLGRSIEETVASNSLDSGQSYSFLDVVTVTFEPSI